MVGQCYLSEVELEVIKYTYGSAATAWTPINVSGVGVLIPQASYSASVEGAYYKSGAFSFPITSGVTLAVGGRAYLDTTAGTVQTAKPTAGFQVGTVIAGGTGNAGGTVFAKVAINEFGTANGNFGDMDISTTGKIMQEFDRTVVTGGTATLTTEQSIAGCLLIDPSGGAATMTTATAAAIVAALNNPKAGTAFDLVVKNTADANEVITIAGGTGVTVEGTATIAQNATKIFKMCLTNVGSGTEAIVLQSIGTLVH